MPNHRETTHALDVVIYETERTLKKHRERDQAAAAWKTLAEFVEHPNPAVPTEDRRREELRQALALLLEKVRHLHHRDPAAAAWETLAVLTGNSDLVPHAGDPDPPPAEQLPGAAGMATLRDTLEDNANVRLLSIHVMPSGMPSSFATHLAADLFFPEPVLPREWETAMTMVRECGFNTIRTSSQPGGGIRVHATSVRSGSDELNQVMDEYRETLPGKPAAAEE